MTDPAFDFQELLKQSAERAQAAEYDFSGLFSLSPLSSPESSRPSSPVNLLSLSPLSSPEPSRPSSPVTHPSHALGQETPFLDESSTSQKLHTMPMIAIHQPVDRVKKRKRQSHHCQNKKRAKEKEIEFSPYVARPAVKAKYVNNATSIHTSASVETSRTASTAYVALDDRIRSRKFYWLHELVGPASKLGFILQEWDGVLSPFKFLFLIYF